ncbi:MAG: DNA polymerase I [Planctomycetaceae bacterium]
MSELLYIIDAYSLIFQVFHALPEMTGPNGQPTNAVFGFARDLQYLQNEKKPTYLICAMDSSGPGERSAWFGDYKMNRSEMPDDLRPQIPLIVEVLSGFRVPVIEHSGWEADDVIATITRQAVERGMDVRIVTSDKDARQLLGPHVELFNVRKNAFYNAKSLEDDWGIRPDQVIDFQALVGDAVDNVPGVPLVGPKKAQALLQQFGTLEDVLANADKAPGAKLKENLKNFADQALLSRRLVTLNTDLPLEVDWEASRVREPDYRALHPLFLQLGFKRLADEMLVGAQQVGAEGVVDAGGTPPVDGSAGGWKTIDTPADFKKLLADLKKQKRFCIDLETTSLTATQADIVGWALAWQDDVGYYIPVDCPPGQKRLEAKTVLDALRPILEDPNIEIVNQNIKYDMLVLRRAGVHVRGVGLDPMVGDYLLDAGARSHGLDTLAQKYLQHRMIPIKDLIGSGKQQKKMFEVDVEKAAEYAAEDARVAWQIAKSIEQDLRKENLWELYWELERPLIPVLAEMEWTGIRVDVDELARQSAEVTARLESLIQQIHKEAGREFNIDSPLQLRGILFDELKLPVMKRTKTGASTDQEVLEKLAPLHPLPAKIIEHRQLSKLKGTYLDALPLMVNPETGRIHASFNQVVAATGRLSSSDPNLQNIPIRTEEGRRVRRAFLPGQAGWKLVCADYSQIELRMLAHFSGDEALRAAFQAGIDIHTAVAAEVFEIDPSEVDSGKRRIAKAVNFGVIYGQSPFGLAATLGIPQEEAARFIESYFGRYAGVDRYLQQILEDCVATGYARTILGRRRAITGIRNTGGRQRNLPERTAINTVIQGSAADLIKKAMINIHARIEREKHPARMLLQIHDELVFETPEPDTESLIALVKREMEHAIPLDVPLVVDVSVGDNWLEVRPLDDDAGGFPDLSSEDSAS